MEIIDRHAPLKKRRLGKAKTPWINKNLLTGKWQKNILKRKACKTNTPNDWKSYKVVKNQYNRLIKNTIKSYYTEEIKNNKGNLKHTWKTINQLISKQPKTSRTLKMIRTRRFWERISTNKATGPDKIPAKLVKISATFISKHLTIIFNQSLSQGTFLYNWKISKVTPIYKKGPKHDMNNYRPISVISTIAKVM